MANKNLAGQKPDFGGTKDEADDPNILRSPVTVRRYAGVAGDAKANRNAGDAEGERVINAVLAALGCQGGQPQRPDHRLIQAAAEQIQKIRGN